MGKTWNYQYSIVLRWKDESGLAGVLIEVNELTYAWTKEECKKRFLEVGRGLYEDSRMVLEAEEEIQEGC